MSAAPLFVTAEDRSQALELLDRYGDDAVVLAGGQSVVPLLNLGLLRPNVIIDIHRLDELREIQVVENVLRIGALVRHHQILESEAVRRHCPLLVEAAALIGHPQIRNCGTIGGSVAHADPAAEYPSALVALGGSTIVQSTEATREVAADQMFLTYLTTSLEKRELVTELAVPVLAKGTGWSFQELAFRRGDFAVVGVAALVELDERGVCRKARLALAGVDAIPLRPALAEALLIGSTLDFAIVKEAGRVAATEIQPEDDLRASADYRRRLTDVYVCRALTVAAERALLPRQDRPDRGAKS